MFGKTIEREAERTKLRIVQAIDYATMNRAVAERLASFQRSIAADQRAVRLDYERRNHAEVLDALCNLRDLLWRVTARVVRIGSQRVGRANLIGDGHAIIYGMDIRLINMTAEPLEIEDGIGGYMILRPGVPTGYPGEIAGAHLRRLLREGKVQIEDEPPGFPPVA